APDRLADSNGPDRDLVTRRNAVARGYAVRHGGAGRQARARDQHAIIGMQSDDGWGRHAISPLFIAKTANGGGGLVSSAARACRAQAIPLESLRVCATCILA